MNNIDENTYVFGADQNEEASETFDFTQINGLGEENYENPDDLSVRKRLGMLSGFVGIFGNLLLFSGKFFGRFLLKIILPMIFLT